MTHPPLETALFMDHTLATIDVLIAAERLCRTQPVTLSRLLIERQLRAHPTRVTLPAVENKPARSVAVIPDAWFELAVAGHQPIAIAVELDRGTEDQKRWRGKVAALAVWAAGSYRQAFDAETLTVAVVTPIRPAATRCAPGPPGADPHRCAGAGRDLPGHRRQPGDHPTRAAVLRTLLV